MLAENFVLNLDNGSDQQVTLNATPNPWKFDANGALAYRGAQSALQAIAASGNNTDTSSYDNSANLDLGMHLDLQLVWTGINQNTVTIYLKPLNADQNVIALASFTFSGQDTGSIVLPAEL